jgi:hypothetical protein
MTVIALPDGTTADFPDGMSQDDIASAIGSHLNQMQGPLRDPAMFASNVAQGALAGAGAVGDLEDWIGNKLKTNVYDPYIHPAVKSALTAAFGAPSTNQAYTPPDNPLSSTSLVSGGRALGIADRPDLVPQTPGEQYVASIGQGVGGAIPYLPLGGGSLIPKVGGAVGKVATNLGIGAASGGAGEAAAQNTDYPDAARAVASLATGGALGLLNAPTKVTPLMQAYQRLGMTPELAGDLGGGKITQLVQKTAAELPGGGGIRDAQRRAVGGFEDALNQTADGLGASVTPQEAGAALQTHGQNWLDDFKQQSNQKYSVVDQHIPPTTPTPLTNYSQKLSDLTMQAPALPNTMGQLQSGLPSNLLDSLAKDAQIGTPDWQSVRAIRTKVGEMLTDKNLIGTTGYGDLKQLYGSLSSDLDQAAQMQGRAAQNAYNDATSFTRNGHDFIDNTLSKFVGNQNRPVTPEAAYNAALTGSARGGTMLQSIRDELPDAADELGAAHLRQMSAATPGARPVAGQGPQVSPTTFVTQSNKLSPEATDALYGGLGQRYQDLQDVAGSMRETERAGANTSGTGRFGTTLGLLAVPASIAEGARRGYELGSTLGPVGAGIGGVAGGVAGAASPFVPGLVGRMIALRHPGNYAGYPVGTVARDYPQLRGLLGLQ